MDCGQVLLLAVFLLLCGSRAHTSTQISHKRLDLNVAPLPLGVTLLGQAFDVTTLSTSTGSVVLDSQLDEAPRTQISVLSFGEFSLPENIHLTVLNKRDVNVNSISEYAEYRSTVAAALGLETTSASNVGSGSLEAKSVEELLTSRDLVSVKQTWEVMDLVLGSFDSNGSVLFSRAFEEGLAALPDIAQDPQTWSNFISNWGTHWVWRVVLGLTVELQIETEKCNSKRTNDLKNSITSLFLASTGQINDTSVRSTIITNSQLKATGGNITKCYDLSHCDWLDFITSLNRNNFGVLRVEISPIADVPINNKTITISLRLRSEIVSQLLMLTRQAVKDYLRERAGEELVQGTSSDPCSDPSGLSSAGIVGISLGILLLLALVAIIFLVVRVGKSLLSQLLPKREDVARTAL